MNHTSVAYSVQSGSNLLLSSQIEKLMAATKYTDYLGLKHYKKSKKNIKHFNQWNFYTEKALLLGLKNDF